MMRRRRKRSSMVGGLIFGLRLAREVVPKGLCGLKGVMSSL